MPDLIDYCHDYIEHFNYDQREANERIYNLCVEYILGSTSDKQRQALVNHFSK
jgi:hypothetical protein